jgi:hypothetical protein
MENGLPGEILHQTYVSVYGVRGNEDRPGGTGKKGRLYQHTEIEIEMEVSSLWSTRSSLIYGDGNAWRARYVITARSELYLIRYTDTMALLC